MENAVQMTYVIKNRILSDLDKIKECENNKKKEDNKIKQIETQIGAYLVVYLKEIDSEGMDIDDALLPFLKNKHIYASRVKRKTMGESILLVLYAKPGGVTAGQVGDILCTFSDFKEKRNLMDSIYTNLSVLNKEGKIWKKDKKWTLAPKEQEITAKKMVEVIIG